MPAEERIDRNPCNLQPPLDLYSQLEANPAVLSALIWNQQCLHEQRRWSSQTYVDAIPLRQVSANDRKVIWNAGRAELTTKPGADRLARDANSEVARWLETAPATAAVVEACGTWSRYWNEEEAHHECAFNELSSRLELPQLTLDTYAEFRAIFPPDCLLRTLVLLMMSEINAAAEYGSAARKTEQPEVRRLLRQIAADEVQHMNYFISFAKALIDSGNYPTRNALSVVNFFFGTNQEIEGGRRSTLSNRTTHVNWWDKVDFDEENKDDDLHKTKTDMALRGIQRITGLHFRSMTELSQRWMQMSGS